MFNKIEHDAVWEIAILLKNLHGPGSKLHRLITDNFLEVTGAQERTKLMRISTNSLTCGSVE